MIVNDKLIALLKAWQDQKYQDGYRAGVEYALNAASSCQQDNEGYVIAYRDLEEALTPNLCSLCQIQFEIGHDCATQIREDAKTKSPSNEGRAINEEGGLL